jgi:phosphatidylethanolamine-binding protein (PEBP) family uncharacterized protein
MDIQYNYVIVFNNFFTPEQTQDTPIISFKGLPTNKLYTLIMNDPNAIGGNHIHWLIVNISHSNLNNGKILLEYKGPAPPKDSGMHNYIFSLYEQPEPILLDKMNEDERQIDLNKLLEQLGLNQVKPTYTVKFQSNSFKKGGRKSMRRKNIKTKRKVRKTRRRRRN